MHDKDLVRNFCIIAHIDHGKSTLADRFIEKAQLVDARKMQSQMLDNMDIERERGITIKSQAITLPYTASDGKTYTLNLVDTPGHVDFSYEVSRAISSCEGAILVIDATQGVQAQTLSNMYMALEHDLEILPVINKIDMPAADVESVRKQIDKDLGLDGEEALAVLGQDGHRHRRAVRGYRQTFSFAQGLFFGAPASPHLRFSLRCVQRRHCPCEGYQWNHEKGHADTFHVQRGYP